MDSSSHHEGRSPDDFSVASSTQPANLHFELGMPVWVKRRGQPLLEGEVAYLGDVKFAEGDWVGLRLVGPSIEQGKNDGTVDGIRYFETQHPHQGLFARKNNIKYRTTSHYEAGSGSSSQIPHLVATPPRPTTMERTPVLKREPPGNNMDAPQVQNMFRTPVVKTSTKQQVQAHDSVLSRISEPERPPNPDELLSFASSLSPISQRKHVTPLLKESEKTPGSSISHTSGLLAERLVETPAFDNLDSTRKQESSADPLRMDTSSVGADPDNIQYVPRSSLPRSFASKVEESSPGWCQAVSFLLLVLSSLAPPSLLAVSFVTPNFHILQDVDPSHFLTQLSTGLLLGQVGFSLFLLLPLLLSSLCCCCSAPSLFTWNAARVSAVLSGWMGLLVLVLCLIFPPQTRTHNDHLLLIGGSASELVFAAIALMVSFWPNASGAGKKGGKQQMFMRNRYPVLNTLVSETDLAEPLLGAENGVSNAGHQTNGVEEPEAADGEDEENETSRVRGTRRLLQLASSQVLYLYLGCTVLLVRLPFSLAIPHFVSTTLGALGTGEYHLARQEILYLFVLGSIDAILDFWCVFLFGYANQKIVRDVRLDLFHRLLRMEVAFFDENNSGVLASRLNSDCSEMAGDLTWFFRFSIESFVRITGISAYMLIRSPKLGACALSIVPVVGIVNKLYGEWLSKNAIQVQHALAQSNATAQEALSNVRTVIAFAAEDEEEALYGKRIDEHFTLNVKQLIMQGVYYMAVSTFLINTVVQSALLYFGAYLIENDELTADVLLAFMLYQGQLQNETMNLFQSYTSLVKSSGAGDKVFSLLDRQPPPPAINSNEVIAESDSLEPEPLSYELSLRNVSFAYPGRPEQLVLNKMFLDIPQGSTVALVGSSGCGKTTVVSLLQRFYDPSEGAVLLNGRDLRSYDLSQHRRRIGVVSQDCCLFDGSVLENIIYGSSRRGEAVDDSTTLRDARRAASLAHASDFIEAMPHGYHTIVGEKGVQLSGGQRQRISIARAIYQRPLLLILDEATSALDRESEQAVQEALDDLLQQQHMHQKASTNGKPLQPSTVSTTTTIVIAHRLHTVENADFIAVMSNGMVAEFGEPNALLRRPRGLYRKLVEQAQHTGRIEG